LQGDTTFREPYGARRRHRILPKRIEDDTIIDGRHANRSGDGLRAPHTR
jgi:hypothetical protein